LDVELYRVLSVGTAWFVVDEVAHGLVGASTAFMCRRFGV
jgi:hypothetical protein